MIPAYTVVEYQIYRGEATDSSLRMPCRSGFDLDRLRAMRAHLLAMGRYGPDLIRLDL